AAGLAVGLALQGSLANFAGGVVILLFKPFKVGDLIEAQGYIGSVSEIQIFNTILKTGDNRVVIIPNGSLSSSSMVNINKETTRRVDLSFGIGYGDDIDQAKSLLKSLASHDARVLKDPAPVFVVAELADSSVNFTVRLWVNTSDYWGVFFDMQEGVKKAFDAHGISIPYPQQDVYMHQVA
ncbi:mechanosensitive ion channel protein MscS, partial [Oleiphilus sp. HI0072]